MEVLMHYENEKYVDSASSLSDYQPIQHLSEDEEIINTNVSERVYERSRIKALADERENVQKKTFTKWINSQVNSLGIRIDDLYVDLRDGRILLNLLEVLSKEIVPKATRGRMRIHCLENVDKCLGFLYDQRVHLENVGAHDIVDGNNRLTLGLIWTMILRFQVQDILLDDMPDGIIPEMTTGVSSQSTLRRQASNKAASAKSALLLWCQMKTAGYPSTNIQNFTTSWRNGLGFLALIHKHRPDLVDYSKCLQQDNLTNLQMAFTTAESKLDIASLLDPIDVNVKLPDEKSIITYVASYYHYFNSIKQSSVLNKRLNKLLNQCVDDESLRTLYGDLVSRLLEWIQDKITQLTEQELGNSIEQIQAQMNEFTHYRTKQKPDKFKEKSDIEVLLFTINSNLRAGFKRLFTPSDNCSLGVLNQAWDKLNKAEYQCELCLRNELARQEKLRNLAERFMKKAQLRKTWINDNLALLSKQSLGQDYTSILAAMKKHEAIETDIYAFENNIKSLTLLNQSLSEEGYYQIKEIDGERQQVLQLWKKLLEMINNRREYLDNFSQFYRMLNEMNELTVELVNIQQNQPDSFGMHLMEVEHLLQRQELLTTELKLLSSRIDKCVGECNRYLRYSEKDFKGNQDNNSRILSTKFELVNLLAATHKLNEERHTTLLHCRLVWLYVDEISSEQIWMNDLLELMQQHEQQPSNEDVSSCARALHQHKLWEAEINTKRDQLEHKLMEGKLLADSSPGSGVELIAARHNQLQTVWDQLIDVTEARKLRLMQMADYCQFQADAGELSGWIRDFRAVFEMGFKAEHLGQVELLIRRNQDNMKQVEHKRQNLEGLRAEASVISQFSSIDSVQPQVQQTMDQLDRDYQQLCDLSHKLQDKLLDQLTVYRLLNDADSVRSWITEKEKFLVNFIPVDDIEELELLKHRFENFEDELTKRAEKVFHVNNLSETLVSSGNNPNFKTIIDNQDHLNEAWNKMADVVDTKRDTLLAKYHCNNFIFDCDQTLEWIQDKHQIVNSLELKQDPNEDSLDQVMAIQRRLNHIQRDMCAIQAKIEHLDGQAQLIYRSNLGEDNNNIVQTKLQDVYDHWKQLQQLVEEKQSGLLGKNDVHRLLLQIEEIQVWISQMQTQMAEQMIPESIKEVEKMLMDFNSDREEIENMEGQKDDVRSRAQEYLSSSRQINLSDSQEDSTNQAMLLARIDGLERGWQTLMDLTMGKENLLREYSKNLVFFEDAKEIEKILNAQENFLNRDIYSSNLLSLHEAVTDQEDFVSRMESDKRSLTEVLNEGHQLIAESNFQKEKIRTKCQYLEDRWNRNLQAAKTRKDNIRDRLKLFELMQDIEDLDDNLIEKQSQLSQLNSYTDKNKTALLASCRALQQEAEAHLPKIQELQQRSEKMIEEYKDYKEEIQPVLDNMMTSWNEFNVLLEQKLSSLSNEDKAAILEESTKTVIDFLQQLESQIVVDDDGEDSDGTDEELKINNKLRVLNQKQNQLQQKSQLIDQLQNEADKIRDSDPIKAEKFEKIQQQVRGQLQQISEPLSSKQKAADKQKFALNYLRDVEEQLSWIADKTKLVLTKSEALLGAISPAKKIDNIRCSSLLLCQQLQRWTHNFQKRELPPHQVIYNQLMQTGKELLDSNHPKSPKIKEVMSQLQSEWTRLNDEVLAQLVDNLVREQKLQEYLVDVSEASSWISEQELSIFSIKLDRKDDNLIGRTMRKFQIISEEISNYKHTIDNLHDKCDRYCSDYSNDKILGLQVDLEDNYQILQTLNLEKDRELHNFVIYCDAYDIYKNLEQWILQQTKIARDDSQGRDLDECTVIRDKFTQFTQSTNRIGSERLLAAESHFNAMIDAKHPFAHSISKWKDRLNEIWADLLELIETRIQLLKSAWDLHKWYCDCQTLLDVIEDKRQSILTINELGSDIRSVAILQRRLKNFERDLCRLDGEINNAVAVADGLLPLYSKNNERALMSRRNELIEQFKGLRRLLEEHQLNNVELADYHNLQAMLRELTNWIVSMDQQMTAIHKPSDVSGIELLLSNHRSLKTGIDSKEENFSICYNLGKTLLRSKHAKSNEIKQQIKQLSENREKLCIKWYRLLDELSLMVEVYRWARDAALAEAWLTSQESYLYQQQQHQDFSGLSLEDTIQQLKRHILFQNSQKNHEEKFEQLKRLTTLEMRARQLSPEHKSIQHQSHEYEDYDSSMASTYIPAPRQAPLIKRSASIDSSLDTEGNTESMRIQHQQQTNKQPSYRLTQRPTRPYPTMAGENQSAAAHPATQAMPRRPQPSHSSVLSQSTESLSTNAAATSRSRNIQDYQPRPEDIKIRGPLYRKHQWVSRTIKAPSRSWKSLYVEILNSRLYFFKDERHYQEKSGQLYKREMPVQLRDVVAAPAKDYIKRPCVFRVRIRHTGTEYLFQAGSIVDMNRWIDAINASCLPGSSTIHAGTSSVSPKSSSKSHPNLLEAPSTNSVAGSSSTKGGLKRFFSSIRLSKK